MQLKRMDSEELLQGGSYTAFSYLSFTGAQFVLGLHPLMFETVVSN